MSSEDRSRNTNARRRQWAERALAGDRLALDPIYRTVLGVLDRAIYAAGGQIGETQAERVAAELVAELRAKVPGVELVPEDSPNRAQRDALRKAAENAED